MLQDVGNAAWFFFVAGGVLFLALSTAVVWLAWEFRYLVRGVVNAMHWNASTEEERMLRETDDDEEDDEEWKR